jgi:hypothetical protein
MSKKKIFALGFITFGFLALSFAIAQLVANDFPLLGGWNTQAFYATLKYYFGAYAVYINAWIWYVIGVLFISEGVRDFRLKSIGPNSPNSHNQTSPTLKRLRNRTSRKKQIKHDA